MRFLSNALLMAGARFATLLCSAIAGIITARALGPHGRGLYALPMLDAALATTFAVGLSSATSYFLLNKKSGSSIVGAIVVGCLFVAAVGAVASFVAAVTNHSLWAAVPAMIYVPFYALYSSGCGYFIGRDRFRAAGAINVTNYAITVILIIVGFLIWRPTPYIAVGAWIAGTAITGTLAFLAVAWDSRTLVGARVKPLEYLSFASRSGSLNLFNFLNYRIDIFLVAVLAPLSTLGLYTVAVTGAESALALALAVVQATTPRIGGQDSVGGAAFSARCIRNNLVLAGVTCAVAMLAAPFLVKLLFGQAYGSIVTPLCVLLVGVIFVPIGSIISNYFMLNLGRTDVPIGTASFSAVICGTMSFLLIPRIGMLGAAIASTVAYIVSNAVAVAWFCAKSETPLARVLLIDRADIALYRRLLIRFIPRQAQTKVS